ncbi:hypothetical protein [Pantoea sp. GL120224-02]|uniref:hypothetical protein n=1 Tax=Pantoea sp. GL120224-02 TaxID=1378084 RepID=UPI0011423FBD|nr:hypothetical protein [Pantoea sp. GL120224-02]
MSLLLFKLAIPDKSHIFPLQIPGRDAPDISPPSNAKGAMNPAFSAANSKGAPNHAFSAANSKGAPNHAFSNVIF